MPLGLRDRSHADRDDIPDGDPVVHLSGFGLEDTHAVANSLTLGPDGWIYGAQGSSTSSHITRPGKDASDAPGTYFEGPMLWRYHPESREYEVFAEGGGNVFGIEFDDQGRLFSGTNGGNSWTPTIPPVLRLDFRPCKSKFQSVSNLFSKGIPGRASRRTTKAALRDWKARSIRREKRLDPNHPAGAAP